MSDSIKGLDSFLKKLNTLQAEVAKEVTKQVKREGKAVQGNAKQLCPVNKYGTGGELRQSIKEKTEIEDSLIRSTVFTTKKYAGYVELGTGPIGQDNHEGISPEVNPTYSQKGWTYYDSELDKFIHTKGQPAQPYMYPALKDYEEVVTKNIKVAVKAGLKKVCK
ncbi:MAG: HK97 gp10 family phage protein [Lachnospiraceae bacterium]